MESHPLREYIAKLVEEHGFPQVLDIEHSIEVYKPTLTGNVSPASYYIRPPDGMSANDMIEWFESIPKFHDFRLTLVPIPGLDTFHQPMISADDFTKKHFHDNHLRLVRVEGKSNAAIEAMATFVEALKRPFDEKQFPHHGDFAVSSYQAHEEGRATELKLLYKPADYSHLMRVARLVTVHIEECNLGREITASRHSTKNQPPELILTSVSSLPAGVQYLDALAASLPSATHEEVTKAAEIAQSVVGHVPTETHVSQTHFVQPQDLSKVLPPLQQRKSAIASAVELMGHSKFESGVEIGVVQGGAAIEIKFPRSPSSLWLTTIFNEKHHIKLVASAFIAVRADPILRGDWSAHYHYDSKTGKLHIRLVDSGSEPMAGWKSIPMIV